VVIRVPGFEVEKFNQFSDDLPGEDPGDGCLGVVMVVCVYLDDCISQSSC
jgi:hypothetical protein